MLGHLGRGDARRGPQTQRSLVYDCTAAPHEDRPYLVLVGQGEDPEGGFAAELRGVRPNEQICNTGMMTVTRKVCGGDIIITHRARTGTYRYSRQASASPPSPHRRHQPGGAWALGVGDLAADHANGPMPGLRNTVKEIMSALRVTHLQARQLLLLCDTAASLCSPPSLGC